MREVEPESVQNESAELAVGVPRSPEASRLAGTREAFPLTAVAKVTSGTKASRVLAAVLAGATFLLVLAVILVAALSFRRQTPVQHSTLSQPSHSKPTIISPPTVRPISSPVSSGHNLVMTITDGIAYVGTSDNALYALRINNGSMLWRYKTNGAVAEKPLVVDAVVYASAYTGNTGPGTIYALRASDGALLWHYTGTGGDYLDTPVVDSGVAYVASQNDIMAFQANNGTLLWLYPTSGYTSLASHVVNGVLYASSSIDNASGTVYALRASDGTLLWHYTASSSIYLQEVSDGVVYADAGSGTLVALRSSDGHLLWQRAFDGMLFQFMPLKGVIYAGVVKISPPAAVAPDTGSLLQPLSLGALLWGDSQTIPAQQTVPLKEGLSSVYAIRASDGAILWHYTLANGGNSWASSLSVENGVVYAGTRVSTSNNTNTGYLYALQSSTGSVLWQDEFSTAPSNALLANGVIYLSSDNGSDTGVMYTLRASDGTLFWLTEWSM